MKKIIRLLVSAIFFAIILYITFVFDFKNKNVVRIVAAISSIFLQDIYLVMKDTFKDLFSKDDWKTSQRTLEKKGIINDETYIRISFAYLFRIKVKDKYFLVQNTRRNIFQPVGGAYKFNSKENEYLRENISFEYDKNIPVDEVTEFDYRLRIKNKDLRKFFERFDKTENRENFNDLSREFIEEIFKQSILKKSDFGILSYSFCGRHITKIEKSVFEKHEILLADIIEVKLSDKQILMFNDLMEKKSGKYLFATAEEIERQGVKVGSQDLEECITNHTYKILTQNNDKLTMRNKVNKIYQVKM